MEGFTLVLFMGWILLMGCFGAMYYMDSAVKKADTERDNVPEQSAPRHR